MAAYEEGILDPVHTFQLNPVVRGRWVKISKPRQTTYLVLCEVKVMVEFAVSYGKTTQQYYPDPDMCAKQHCHNKCYCFCHYFDHYQYDDNYYYYYCNDRHGFLICDSF